MFVGVIRLRDEFDIMQLQISLSKLRYLVVDCLQLHPFIFLIEKELINEIKQ